MKSSNDFAIIDSVAHALIALLIVLVLTACGGGGGDAPPDGSAPPGNGPPATEGTLPFKVMPARASLALQGQAAVVAIGSNGTVTWTSSDPTVANVDGSGVVTALARGTATITASDGSGAASSATVQVWDTGGAQPDASTEALIDAALAAGRIDAERALVYRVYAMFADERLPPEFHGAPDTGGGMSLRLLSAQLPTLSAATQDLLQPFLMPPIYRESWFGRQLGLAGSAPSPAGRERAAQAAPPSCSLAQLLPGLERRVTASFTFWTLPDRGTRAAFDDLIPQMEAIYEKQRNLLGRAAKSDADEPCNGGDGSTDIYLFPFIVDVAKTFAYSGRCEDVPAFIVIDALQLALGLFSPEGFDPTAGPRRLRNTLAHELLHTIQFGMDRSADCADYEWIDEATAQWVMDYTFPSDNFEDGFRPEVPAMRGGSNLVDYLLGGHMVPLEQPSNADNVRLNGYADYLFFQFIARKHGAGVIKQLFDAWMGTDSVASIDVALRASGSSLRETWPEFARALWNDAANQVLDDLSRMAGENYDYGVKRAFDASRQYARPLKAVRAQLQGGRADFELLQNFMSGGLTVLPPRSMAFERIVFDDESVSAVLISSPFAEMEVPSLKLHAVVKIGGQWRPVQDWSFEPTKFFCRDQANERLQELVLIVSNGDPETYAAPVALPSNKPLLVSTSNVGCWKWVGNASFTSSGSNGTGSVNFDTRAEDLAFVRRDQWAAFPPVFDVITGGASGSGRISESLSQCTSTLSAPFTTVRAAPADGWLRFNLDLKTHEVPDPDRKLAEAIGSTSIVTTNRMSCPGTSSTKTEAAPWNWLGLLTAVQESVSSDGRTITGNQVTSSNGIQDRQIFTFTALRE